MHELTALSGKMSIRDARHPERFKGAIMTTRLRTEATDHLLAAGRAVRARRLVALATEACPPLAGAARGWYDGNGMMTDVRGGSNAKAKRELGWQLRYPSWRLGFVQGLG